MPYFYDLVEKAAIGKAYRLKHGESTRGRYAGLVDRRQDRQGSWNSPLQETALQERLACFGAGSMAVVRSMKLGNCNTQNAAVVAWVNRMAELCKPQQVFWCDGSEAEKDFLTAEAVQHGVLIQLNQEKLPRPQIVIRRAAPVRPSNSPLPAIVIVGLAFWLVYAFMRTLV